MKNFFARYIDRLITPLVDKRIADIKEQIASEAQSAVDQIKAEIEPTVAQVATVFLTTQVGQLQQLTQDNLQMFQTQLNVLNASHARYRGLIKLLEPHIPTDEDSFELAVEKRGFMYEIELSLADLDVKQGESAHPAIVEHYKNKVGALYLRAQQNGWIEIFEMAVSRHTRDMLEADPDGRIL